MNPGKSVIYAIIFIMGMSAALPCISYSRVGGGSSFEKTAPGSDPSSGASSGKVIPGSGTDSGSDPIISDKQQKKETADWYRDNVKLTEKDYAEFSWFGLFILVLLLTAGCAVTAFMVFVSDRTESFIKGRLIPSIAVNLAVWGIAWAVTRAFSMPAYVITIGIAVTGALLIWDGFRSKGITSGSAGQNNSSIVEKGEPFILQMIDLRREDPGFSLILLNDFIHALYHEFIGRLGKDTFEYISPFLGPSVKTSHDYFSKHSISAEEIVVGSINLRGIELEDKERVIQIEIQANYTEVTAGKRVRTGVIERWSLARKTGTLSPQPERMQIICCPGCGAPANFSVSGKCGHCGSIVKNGLMQWYLRNRIIENTRTMTIREAVTIAEEKGTGLPTIVNSSLQKLTEIFCQEQGMEHPEAFWTYMTETIARPSFTALYHAWSAGNWQNARHLLTDRLYSANISWMDFYKRNNYHNRLDDVQIKNIIPVKLVNDKYYQAATMRIFASCYDYIVDEKGKVTAGSKNRKRNFSEYWTFIRRIDSDKKAAEYSDITCCPACGSPADKMGDTARCGYCGSLISSASFSWVLALITQDEVYEG
jgi:hypothetical protein